MANSFTRYREDILAKYEKEKSDTYARFFINPTRAGLRNLAILLLQNDEKANTVDQRIFKDFIGFEFTEGLQRIKKQTDKFRPLETFLKAETVLSDIAGADMVALLVDFQPRPYSRYLREIIPMEKGADSKPEMPQSEQPFVETPKTGTPKVGILPNEHKHEKRSLWKRADVIIISISVIIFTGYAVKKEAFPAKECMQWKDDHYEEVVCEGKKIGFAAINPIFDRNEELLDFKRIKVSASTTFFKDGQPVVWYIKQDGKCEYFNAPGLHPISGKPLRPVSKHIVSKYVLKE